MWAARKIWRISFSKANTSEKRFERFSKEKCHKALDQIRLFFEKYGSARFQFIDGSGVPDDMRQPHERAGYRRVDRYSGETTYLVYPRYFDEVIARGMDAKHVKKLLKDKGILETDGDRGRYQKKIRIREQTYRMIVLNDNILNEDEKNDWNL